MNNVEDCPAMRVRLKQLGLIVDRPEVPIDAQWHLFDLNQGGFWAKKADLLRMIDVGLSEFPDADMGGALNLVCLRSEIARPTVTWSRSYHTSYSERKADYVSLAEYVVEISSTDEIAGMTEAAAARLQSVIDYYFRSRHPEKAPPPFVPTPKEKRLCGKCFLPVDPADDAVEWEIAVAEIEGRLKPDEPVPVLMHFMGHAHILPNECCEGSPSRAQYVPGQPRDPRPDYAFNEEKVTLYRQALALIKERSRL